MTAVSPLKLLATLARQMVWSEWRAHPWRQLAAVLAVALGVALKTRGLAQALGPN